MVEVGCLAIPEPGRIDFENLCERIHRGLARLGYAIEPLPDALLRRTDSEAGFQLLGKPTKTTEIMRPDMRIAVTSDLKPLRELDVRTNLVGRRDWTFS